MQRDRGEGVGSRPLLLGLVSTAAFAVMYPLIAAHTQQPLALFVIPVLITAALGEGVHVAIVSAVALAVAAIEGALPGDLDGPAFAIRLSIIVIGGVAGTVVAQDRHRRQVVTDEERRRRQMAIDEEKARALLFEAFQISLVPEPIPPSGVSVHVRYLPGDDRLRLGGDFFDAIPLPSGSLGYIIGDVCGHGPRAAGFGAAVRSGWKSLAIHQPDDPLTWVEALDETFFRLGRHRDTYVTLNTGVFWPETSRLSFVSAGHPWPIVVGPAVRMLRPAVGPPLGAVPDARWSCSSVELEPGAALLLYTDGLIENRSCGHRADAGEAALLEFLRSDPHPLDLDRLIGRFGPEGFDDDVALMSIRAGAPGDPARTTS